MWQLIKELTRFLREEKKWWLVPLVVVLLLLAAVVVISSSSAVVRSRPAVALSRRKAHPWIGGFT